MTPEIPMDALRVIARRSGNASGMDGEFQAIRAYVQAVDAQADAAKDEALAVAMLSLFHTGHASWNDIARAARAYIAKEQQ